MTLQLLLIAALAMLGVLLAGILLGLVEVSQNPAASTALGDALASVRILPGWTR